jgi:hypothetical protein
LPPKAASLPVSCAFFTSKQEEYRVMLPFIAEDFKAAEKLVHTIDKDQPVFFDGGAPAPATFEVWSQQATPEVG